LLGKINSSGYCGALVALINNLGEAERWILKGRFLSLVVLHGGECNRERWPCRQPQQGQYDVTHKTSNHYQEATYQRRKSTAVRNDGVFANY
jgi:hypothetical protein